MSIADKLTKIAENEPKIYEAGMQAAVDKLCPSFTKSGSIVVCEPVEGYPLTVEASEAATKIVRCGKNLFDINMTGYSGVNNGGYTLENGTLKVVGFAIRTPLILVKPSTRYTLAYKSKRTGSTGGGMFARAQKADGTSVDLFNIGGTVNGKQSFITPTAAVSVDFFLYGTQDNSNGTDYSEFSEIQLEVGDTATAYEPYKCDTFAPNEPITALKGVNTLYADSGEITVKGKADPVAIIEKLSSTVTAILEG